MSWWRAPQPFPTPHHHNRICVMAKGVPPEESQVSQGQNVYNFDVIQITVPSLSTLCHSMPQNMLLVPQGLIRDLMLRKLSTPVEKNKSGFPTSLHIKKK